MAVFSYLCRQTAKTKIEDEKNYYLDNNYVSPMWSNDGKDGSGYEGAS